MLIVEGPDYSGKTTLLMRARKVLQSERWGRRFGWQTISTYHHLKPPPGWDYVGEYRAAARMHQLADRFAPSELAYGDAFRGGPNPEFTPHRRRLVARELNRLGTVGVLLAADAASITERLKTRGDPHVKAVSDYARVLECYRAALATDLALGVRGIRWADEIDSSDGNWANTEPALRAALDLWRIHLDRATSVEAFLPGGWGYLWPRVLFVGEQYNGQDPDGRAFGNDDGASQTLSDLLDAAEIGEKDCYFVNSRSGRWGDVGAEGIAWLAPRVVIALGEDASRDLRKRGVKHERFPHPSYLRRFEAARLARWSASLREVAAKAYAAPGGKEAKK